MNKSIIDEVIEGYEEAIYFTESRVGMDDGTINKSDMFSTLARLQITFDCQRFLELLEDGQDEELGMKYTDAFDIDWRLVGHDFWLTRNGHGAGFWDGDWPENFGEFATDICDEAGEADVYSEHGIIDFEHYLAPKF